MKFLNKKALFRALAGVGLFSAALAANAATITVTPSDTTPDTNGTFTVTLGYTTDSATTNFNLVLNYDTTLLNATTTSTTGSPFPNTCSANDALGRVAVITTSGTGTALAGGNFCTITFTTGATAGTVNFTLSNTNFTGSAGGDTLGSASVTVTAPPAATGPSIVAGSPAFGSSTAVAGGTLGGAAVTSNVSFGASTGGAAGGTTDLTCTDDDANSSFTNTTQNDIADAATPATMVGSFTPGAARTVTLSCTAVRQGTTDQTFSYTFNVAAGSVASGPTLTAPATTTFNLGSALVGSQVNASIQFSATGGDAGQSTALNCTATAPAVLVSGGTQTVATGATPAAVVAGIVLTGAPQTGTVTCNGTVFTLNAPAGSVFVAPEIIPASSLWSQLSLIALFSVLGGVFVALRRNA